MLLSCHLSFTALVCSSMETIISLWVHSLEQILHSHSATDSNNSSFQNWSSEWRCQFSVWNISRWITQRLIGCYICSQYLILYCTQTFKFKVVFFYTFSKENIQHIEAVKFFRMNIQGYCMFPFHSFEISNFFSSWKQWNILSVILSYIW